MESVLVCGNAFEAVEYDSTLYLWLTNGLHVTGNHWPPSSGWSYVTEVHGLLFDHNRHEGEHGGLEVEGSARVTRNAFTGAEGVYGTGVVDASSNWWGSADGPSGDGSGSGANVGGAGVTFTPWLAAPPVTDVDCASVPIPPPPPPMHTTVQSFVIDAPAAWRAHVDATGSERVTVHVDRPRVGAEVAWFRAEYDPARPEDAESAWALNAYAAGGARVTAADADARAHRAAYRVDWGGGSWWSCTGSTCPPAGVFASLTRNVTLPTRVTVITEGNATADVVTGPARLITMDDPDRVVAVTADGLHAGAVVNHDSETAFTVQHRLWGFAAYPDALAGASSFRLERPDGGDEHVARVTFLADEPGTYAFRADGARAGTHVPQGYALVVDVPP